MKTFSESSQHFQFDKRWKILRFDQHRFYRYLSGQGLKGVDFLAADWKEEKILLIEVKNFDPVNWSGESPTMQAVLDTPEAYAEKIINKFTDSLYLFQIIYEYYQRKWWYPLCGPLLLKIVPQAWTPHLDFVLWNRLYHLTQSPQQQIHLLLFLEWKTLIAPEKIEVFNQVLSQKINTHFSSKPFSFRIASQDSPYPGIVVKDFKERNNL